MKKLVYLAALIFLFSACKKEDYEHLSGNYSGTFRIMINQKMVMSDFDLSLNATQFRVTKGYKKGSGTYSSNQKNELVFVDQNMWTADFDWNLLLSGTYTSEIKGDSLILTKYLPTNPLSSQLVNYYQYRLKKLD